MIVILKLSNHHNITKVYRLFWKKIVTSLLDFNSTEVSHPPSFLKLRFKKLEMSFHFTCLWMVPSNSVFPSRNSERESEAASSPPNQNPTQSWSRPRSFNLQAPLCNWISLQETHCISCPTKVITFSYYTIKEAFCHNLAVLPHSAVWLVQSKVSDMNNNRPKKFSDTISREILNIRKFLAI